MAKYRFEQIAINSTEKKKPVEEDRFTYLGLEHLDSGSLKVTRFGSEVAPIGEKLVMHKGDVLFGKRRAYQKKVAIAPFDGMHIFEYLKEDVKIIWYEVGESEDAISLFTRLNIGKIPLTSAELVKAMFLSRDNAENMRREKQEEISLQWDGIERELHNEALWFFLTNSVKGEYQTRIDLVLDLIAGKEESTREKYYTFFRFDELRKEVSLDDIWKKIYQTFLTLKGWYEDHDLYHRIGYLITSGTSLHPVFRPGSYGKMSNDDVVNKPYMFSVMQTKTQWSQNTYMPYLKEADDDHLSRDEMGQYLVYDDVYIVCENNSYGVYRNDDDSLTDTVTISQNEAGIDTEDRIIKLKKYIANMK